MQIKISYESKYSLSTTHKGENVLTGMSTITEGINKNVKHIFKKDNNFLENIKELNKYYPNYQYADITQNTVLGILCRLVGEVRRLDCLDITHPIISLKNKISFKNENTSFQNETVLLHTPLKEVQNNAGGVIPEEKCNHFLLTKNTLSETLMSVFQYQNKEEIIQFLTDLNNNNDELFYSKYHDNINVKTFVIEHSKAETKQKEIIKGLEYSDGVYLIKEINERLFYGKITNVHSLENYIKNNIDKEGFKPATITEERKKYNVAEIFNIAGFLFAKKISFLRNNNLFFEEFEKSLNSNKTSIKGLAPGSGSITIKDYYSNFVSDKKLSWTMPYCVDIKKDLFEPNDLSEFNPGAKIGVTKESGNLTISLDLSLEEELFIYKRIENAGVGPFQLGKKGLAYVSDIILEKL